MKKQYLYDAFLDDSEIVKIVRTVAYPPVSGEIRRHLYNRMVMICEDLTNNKAELGQVLKPSFYKNSTAWLNGQWINRFSKSIKQTSKFKNGNAWESEIEGFVVLLTEAGFFSYANALHEAKTFKFLNLYGNPSINVKKLLNIGKSLTKNRQRVKPKIDYTAPHNFYNNGGPGFSRLKTFARVDKIDHDVFRVEIHMRHVFSRQKTDCMIKLASEHLSNALGVIPNVKLTHVGTGEFSQTDDFPHVLCVRFEVDNRVVKTSPAELTVGDIVTPKEPDTVIVYQKKVTDEDIRAYLENKLSVLSDEIGVLIQERDSITEQINDRTDKIEQIRKIIEVM